MVWLLGVILMIVCGAAGVVIGWYLSMLYYAIVGGILLVVGILGLVASRRSGGPLSRDPGEP